MQQPDDLIEQIKQRRTQIGMSQRKLAAAVGIGHGHLSQIESGTVIPGIDTVRKLLDALSLTVETAPLS